MSTRSRASAASATSDCGCDAAIRLRRRCASLGRRGEWRLWRLRLMVQFAGLCS